MTPKGGSCWGLSSCVITPETETVSLAAQSPTASLGPRNRTELRRGGSTCPVAPAILLSVIAILVPASASDWPGFRGDGTSITRATNLPLVWSDQTNLAWHISLAGPGQSSPILWRDRVYTTSVVGPQKEKLVIQASALADGRELWRFEAASTVPEEISDTRSQSAPTPVAGADGVFALFESGDCFALNHGGQLRWHRPLTEVTARIDSNHGLGGSPVLTESTLIIPLDQGGPSCLLALDRRDGRVLWKTVRPNKTAWSTPVLAGAGEKTELIVSGGGTVAGYDPQTGRQLWEFNGLVRNNVPSPTLQGDLLIIGAGGKGSNLALQWRSGTNAPVERWRSDATSGFASPLLHRGRVYFLSSAGVLTCVEAGSGRTLFEERMGMAAWASPLGAEDRVYFFGEKGRTLVLAAVDSFQPLQTNILEFTGRVSGVAVTGGTLLLRANEKLVCVRHSGER